jgi:hypothetical protein
MPNCFQLTRKGSQEPEKLANIDKEICALLEQPVDPILYCESWYDTIGFGLACGKDWVGLREVYKDYPALLKVIDYLETNYTFNAWYEPKRF